MTCKICFNKPVFFFLKKEWDLVVPFIAVCTKKVKALVLKKISSHPMVNV